MTKNQRRAAHYRREIARFQVGDLPETSPIANAVQWVEFVADRLERGADADGRVYSPTAISSMIRYEANRLRTVRHAARDRQPEDRLALRAAGH